MASPKIIFRSNHNFAVNHKDNRYKIYYGTDKNGKARYKQCKNKDEYQMELEKYICGENGFFKYSRNEQKAKISMFDYFVGAKKSEDVMRENKMKREEMMMMSNGKYATDEDTEKMKTTWRKYLKNSNVHQMIVSFNNDYIDENISLDKLQSDVTTKILPLFFKKCGFVNPEKNLDWVVSLHCDQDNYHFHICCLEKRKSYLSYNNKLTYRNKLEFTEKENNFFKRQIVLDIEREKLYTPALIKFNNELDEFRKYFNPKGKNFILLKYKNIDFEEKILRLGYLVNKVRTTDKKYIKYNSLPKNEIGNEIRNLTKEIRKELFKEDILKGQKKNIFNSIDEINKIFEKIDADNNISNIGYESALDNKLIKAKLEKNDNYVLNAIVNHALYKTRNMSDKIKSDEITFNDLLNEIALDNFRKELNKDMSNVVVVRKTRIKILKNHFNNIYTSKDNVSNSIKRLEYNRRTVEEQFRELFVDDNNKEAKAILER